MGSLGSVALMLVVGAVVSWAGGQGGSVACGLPVFSIAAAFAFAFNWLVFLPAYVFQSERYFDLTGSLTFLGILALGLGLSAEIGPRALLLALLIAVWAVRLGSFLFFRIKRDGADRRFDRLKVHFPRFLMTWTLQALWVLLTISCALAAITAVKPVALGVPAIVGTALWVLGFTLELVADRQKSAFRAVAANRERFITSGLWAYSRHPNYLGEIVLWIGIAVISLPELAGWSLLTLISPFFVAVLLVAISGIPLLEERARRKWGGDPDFESYITRTPRLFPGFRAKP